MLLNLSLPQGINNIKKINNIEHDKSLRKFILILYRKFLRLKK